MSIIDTVSGSTARNLYTGGLHASETASVFAAEIARRAAANQGAGQTGQADTAAVADGAPASGIATDKNAQLQKLESALAGTVAYMVDKHGEKAGTALMGIVLKRLGESGVTEESLGNAFLDVTRFIDSNFGVEHGDAFLEHLNGDLNSGLNAFFDNGHNEAFLASTSLPGSAETISGLPAAMLNAESAVDSIKRLTESILHIIGDARDDEPGTAAPADPVSAAYSRKGDTQAMLTGILTDIVV